MKQKEPFRINCKFACFYWLPVVYLLFSMPVLRARAADHDRPLASAAELVQLVNQLRVANGLPPYSVNQTLMAVAQAHSAYQASIGVVTHTGAGGTRPYDRASAAGYGGGEAFFISENIGGGTSLTAAEVVQMWQGDSLHLNTMLSPNYQEIGAGVAEADGIVYFTIDAAYVAGGVPAQTTPVPASGTTQPAGITIIPVVTVTPFPDGAIIHEVQPGQALWNIAAAYNIALSDLLELNNLTNTSVIYPGDKLFVRKASPSATATLTPTATSTPRPPTRTLRPTLTPTPTSQPQESPGAGTPQAQAQAARAGADPMLALIGILVLVGGGLLVFGGLLNRRPPE